MQPPLSWHNRKLQYLAQLHHAPLAVQRVVIADKLHNVRSLLASLQQEGIRVWDWFTVEQSETLWFYKALGEIFQAWEQEWQENYWIKAYGQILEELEQLSTAS